MGKEELAINYLKVDLAINQLIRMNVIELKQKCFLKWIQIGIHMWAQGGASETPPIITFSALTPTVCPPMIEKSEWRPLLPIRNSSKNYLFIYLFPI